MSSRPFDRRRPRRFWAGREDAGTLVALASICVVVFLCFFLIGRAASPKAVAAESALPGFAPTTAAVPGRIGVAPAIALVLPPERQVRRPAHKSRPAGSHANETKKTTTELEQTSTGNGQTVAATEPAKKPVKAKTTPTRTPTKTPAKTPTPAHKHTPTPTPHSEGPGAAATGTPPAVSPTGASGPESGG